MKKGILLLMVVLLSISVSGISLSPEDYWGFVYVEGEGAEEGLNLSVSTAEGELLGRMSLPFSSKHPSSFKISIPFDDPATTQDEGAVEGESIVWELEGLGVKSPVDDTAESGKVNKNIEILGVLNPDFEISFVPAAEVVIIGEPLRGNVHVDNKGLGKGSVFLSGIDIQSIETNLPQIKNFTKSSSGDLPVEINVTECGQYNIIMGVICKNIEGMDIECEPLVLDVDVEGPDLYIANVTVDEEVVVSVKNKGTQPITEYGVEFFHGTEIADLELIKNITDVYHILPNESYEYKVEWDRDDLEGQKRIFVRVAAIEDECDNSDNLYETDLFFVDGLDELTGAFAVVGKNSFSWLKILLFTLLSGVIVLLVVRPKALYRINKKFRESGIRNIRLPKLRIPTFEMPRFRKKVRSAPVVSAPVKPTTYVGLKSLDTEAGKEESKKATTGDEPYYVPLKAVSGGNEKRKVLVHHVKKEKDVQAVLEAVRSSHVVFTSLGLGMNESKRVLGVLKKAAEANNSKLFMFGQGHVAVLPKYAGLKK